MIGQGLTNVLLIEDNEGDVDLTRLALKQCKLAITLHVAEDGIEALAMLHRDEPYQAVPRPDLILLDLNLPRMDGRELLAKIKADRDLLEIPVVILTTSQAEEDIFRTYQLHANCYISKPLDLQKFIDVVQQIEDFWLTIVKLPRK